MAQRQNMSHINILPDTQQNHLRLGGSPKTVDFDTVIGQVDYWCHKIALTIFDTR